MESDGAGERPCHERAPVERAGIARGVVGKEYVGAVGAFLTNDFAAVRARGRLVIIGADVQYRPDAQVGSGPRLIRRRAPCAFFVA